VRLEQRITIAAPRDAVWEHVARASRYPRFMRAMTRFEPADGSPDELCLGARYSMLMHVGSADVGGLVEIVEHDAPAELAWTSVTGIDQRLRWRLRESEEPGATDVTLRFTYGSPGGIVAAVVDRFSAGEVEGNLRRSLTALKADIEGEPAQPEGGSSLSGRVRGIVDSVAYGAGGVKVLAKAGIVRPVRPDRLAKVGLTLARWGRGPAAGFISGAMIAPHERAIVDDLGTLTFDDVNRRTNALAHALADAGVKEGDGVAIMCRNHRWFVEATVAVAKIGANALYLNTAFAAPQLTEVVKREKPVAIVYDEEFAGLLEDAGRRRKRFVAWHDSEATKLDDPTLESLVESGSSEAPVPPGRVGRAIILTSGTTGTPKGADRASPESLDPAISFLSKIPLRQSQVTHIAAPLFHSWGFAHFTIGLLLNSTLILTRKFDPENCLALVARERAESLAVVPVMMQRILELPEETRRKYDTSSLRVTAVSGSALPGDLASTWMDEFGDNLYNLYGSTEVAWASIATPQDMRAAPGTAGRAPRGTELRLYDENGVEVPRGETGRIFVANTMLFEGYTGDGGTKDAIEGAMATGDVGRIDDAGRLFVEGRDDDMIVSGGENLFPQEVENLIARRDDVAEVAAIGVDDEKFGQRLRAFVVPKSGSKPSEDDIKKHVKENLANFKVPREVWFLEELPRNATGKVLKRELKEIEESPK
jgi:fatty-acyl-CoA synthase